MWTTNTLFLFIWGLRFGSVMCHFLLEPLTGSCSLEALYAVVSMCVDLYVCACVFELCLRYRVHSQVKGEVCRYKESTPV